MVRGFEGAAGLPVRADAQDGVGAGEVLADALPSAGELVVLDGVQVTAVAQEEHRHGRGGGERVQRTAQFAQADGSAQRCDAHEVEGLATVHVRHKGRSIVFHGK